MTGILLFNRATIDAPFRQGTVRGVLDSAVNRDSTWHSRDFEAHVLVDILRLSRLTVLYGAEGAGKTTLLKTDVLPLLRPCADDHFVQDENRGMAPLSDETVDRGADIAIVFDRWDNAPLTALRAQILNTLRIESTQVAAPLRDLAGSLAAWNKELGVRFFIIFDGFEQYLRAPIDRAGIAEFEEEFVRTINTPRLATHFLLSVRDDAEELLNRFRGRISGFGDAFLRLPNVHHVTAPPPGLPGHAHRPAAAAGPPGGVPETLSIWPVEPPKPHALPAISAADPAPAQMASFADSGGALTSKASGRVLNETQALESTANAAAGPNASRDQAPNASLAESSGRLVAPPSMTAAPRTSVQAPLQEHPPQSSGARQPVSDDKAVNDARRKPALRGITEIEPTIRERVQLYKNSNRVQFMFAPRARGAATSAPAPRKRNALKRSLRKFGRVSLGAIVAGLVIGAGAGYFTILQSSPAWQPASSPRSSAVVTLPAADPSAGPVNPVTRADSPAPLNPEEPISAVHRSVSPPDPSPAPVNPVTRAGSPAPLSPQEGTSMIYRPVSPRGSPTPIKNTKDTAPTREVAARIAPPNAVSIAPAVVSDWKTEMHRELDVCRQERFFLRVVCTENVRWKRCAPDRWNSIPECAVGGIQMTSSD